MNKEQYIRKILKDIKVTNQIKKRIRHDIQTELESKEEAGLTIDEIISQKGTPEKVAVEFNQSYSDKDMRRQDHTQKSLKIAAIVFLSLALLVLICIPFLAKNAAMGIIGGADGATGIIMTPHSLGVLLVEIVGLLFFVLGGAFMLVYFIKRKISNRC